MIDRDIGTQESENEWETELREMILYTYYIAGRVEVVLYVLDGSIFGRRSISRAFASGEDRGGSHLRVLPADVTVLSEIYGPDALTPSLKMSFCSLSRARGRNARTIYGRDCFSDARAALAPLVLSRWPRV